LVGNYESGDQQSVCRNGDDYISYNIS